MKEFLRKLLSNPVTKALIIATVTETLMLYARAVVNVVNNEISTFANGTKETPTVSIPSCWIPDPKLVYPDNCVKWYPVTSDGGIPAETITNLDSTEPTPANK